MQRFFFVFLFVLIGACVDPLEVRVNDFAVRLVVDGLITDAPGPYTVKLYYTDYLKTTRLSPFVQVRYALVQIFDETANTHTLTEVAPGVYQTDSATFRGQVGKSYALYVQTTDNEYRTDFQTLRNSGIIEDVYFKYHRNAVVSEGRPADGLEIFVDSRGMPGEQNLFRWRWTTVHKVRSFPEREVRLTPGGPRPNPDPCSGYVPRGSGVVQVGECTCCICWSYRYNEKAHVSKNDFVNEVTFNKQSLGIIPVTSMHFFEKYHLEVQQLTLSEEVYDFWNLLEKQQKGATNLFQPNAAKIRGNVYCTRNPDEEVLGIFEVAGVASRSIFIDPSLVVDPLPPIDTIEYPCNAYFLNSTTQKPFFW